MVTRNGSLNKGDRCGVKMCYFRLKKSLYPRNDAIHGRRGKGNEGGAESGRESRERERERRGE